MHVTTREVDQSGTHILTSVIESDGATAMCSDQAELSAKVISINRTPSGGIQVQIAVDVKEPAPVVAAPVAPPAPEPTLNDQAVAYFTAKGFTEKDAQAQVDRFGITRVLAIRDKELSDQLAALVAPKSESPAPPNEPTPAVN